MGVFQAYVDSREDYDVIYSRKAGYLRVITAENCDRIYFPIAGFRDLVRMFTDDFLTDEEELQKGEGTAVISFFIDALFEKLLQTEGCESLIINPWGNTFGKHRKFLRKNRRCITV